MKNTLITYLFIFITKIVLFSQNIDSVKITNHLNLYNFGIEAGVFSTRVTQVPYYILAGDYIQGRYRGNMDYYGGMLYNIKLRNNYIMTFQLGWHNIIKI